MENFGPCFFYIVIENQTNCRESNQTFREAIEKSSILLSQYLNNIQFESNKIITYFGCTNNFFAC